VTGRLPGGDMVIGPLLSRGRARSPSGRWRGGLAAASARSPAGRRPFAR